jgi:hypothetical protein
MKDKNRLAELDREAATLMAQFYALEERVIKFSQIPHIQSVTTTVLLLQHLFKIANDVVKAIEALLTPAEHRAEGATTQNLGEIMTRHNMPEWLKKKFVEDVVLGQWYFRFLTARPKVAEWLEVADKTTLPSKIAEFRELNAVMERLVLRTEGLLRLRGEYASLFDRTSLVRDKVFAIAKPWSQHGRDLEPKYVLAYAITRQLERMLKEAARTFDGIDVMQASSSFHVTSGVLERYAVKLSHGKSPFRRLTRQSKRLTKPLQKRFSISPDAYLLASLQDLCLQMERIDLLVAKAQEDMGMAA